MSAKNQLLSSLSINKESIDVQSNDKQSNQLKPNQLKQPNQSNKPNQPNQLNGQLKSNQNESKLNANDHSSTNQLNQVNNQVNDQVNDQVNNQEKPNPLNESSNSSINNHKSMNGHDSLSEASFSDDKSVDDKNDNLLSDLFPNITFSLKEVFRLSVRFTKENENKAFHPSYDDRNFLYALNYQIRYGQLNEDTAPQLGAFDFVGKDRRLAWKSLGNMTKEAAMKQFVSELNRICPTFKPFIEAHNQEKVEREKILREEEERRKLEEEQRLKELEEERAKKDEQDKQEKYRQALREALKKQTYAQFKSYAVEQYPDNIVEQENLIKSLEEQHFQQYIQQMMQFQEQRQLNQFSSDSQDDLMANEMQRLNMNGDKQDNDLNFNNLNNQFNINQQNYLHNNYVDQENGEEESDVSDNEDEEEDDEEQSESENEVSYDDNYEAGYDEDVRTIKDISPPQIWTKKIIKQFKESISIDSGDGVIKVGYGENLTIRVPTHPDGNCIIWEFATDNYDIGFGLFFEYNDDPGDRITVEMSESENEDEDQYDDPEKGASGGKKEDKTKYVLPIVPVFRRDCHEEVYAGSHVYPGKGVYLLKFDNTYSLWRTKTLYYRVFFSS